MLSHQPGDVVVVRGHPYQLLELMGRGGQGSVFDARDDKGQRVAIKLVPAHPRHKNEVRILAGMQADHVVKLLDAGLTRDTLILVLERVEGVDLKALVHLCRDEARVIPANIAVELIHQACLGLVEASQHARLEFHRDIKPGNLILSRHGIVKLIDFGIAHRQGMDYTGSLIGTPENMAPEQVGLDESWKVDIRTDLYCLGLVLFELLTLETLFRFPDTMPIPERLMEVWNADVRARLQRIDPIHPAIGTFLRRALQRNPRDRFQTPAEMLQGLTHLRSRLPPSLSIEAFADCLYKVSHEGERPPLLEVSLPSAITGPTVSLELGAERPTPQTRRRPGWLRRLIRHSAPFRSAAAGVLTVLFALTVLWLLVTTIVSHGRGGSLSPEATSDAAGSASTAREVAPPK